MLRYDHIIVNYQGNVFIPKILYHFLSFLIIFFVNSNVNNLSLFCPPDMGL